MDNRGLLFIPDISGFTRFITETEIEHSRYIIQELLEILINANHIGLQISEIEGDAILFYKFGDPPSLQDIYRQVEDMFCAFHRHLIAYDCRRYCQCEACSAAIDLTLKVITHYGEFAGYNVKNFNKLIGKDVIVAHQLLKNDIQQHEYWLVTQNLLADKLPQGITEWMQWMTSIKETETGSIPFHYTMLSRLKNELPPETLPQPELTGKTKVISVSQEYQTDIITLFHATGDFTFRNRWQQGVKKIEEVNHLLPRIGMRCRCIMESGKVLTYRSSSYNYHPNKIEFGETEEKNNCITYFTLEKITDHTTRLTLDYYLSQNLIAQLRFKLNAKSKRQAMLQSLSNLEMLVAEMGTVQ